MRMLWCGSRHLSTLDSIYNYADLLVAIVEFQAALPLFVEQLEGLAELFGIEHEETGLCGRRCRPPHVAWPTGGSPTVIQGLVRLALELFERFSEQSKLLKVHGKVG